MIEDAPMMLPANDKAKPYFPAVVCVECDSPIDALLALCVPRDEAMDLVAASWRSDECECILTTVDGGRSVAAIRTPAGRWAACHAFLEHASATRSEAERQLRKLLKRGRQGYVGELPACRESAI
jgi:hypothetical protein